ncbi:MAG: hypothetical protein LBB88_08515, partial [Planctomycetaceae bacterium]|nr:hypothetical protein [Planctomycetaceae bacterium]
MGGHWGRWGHANLKTMINDSTEDNSLVKREIFFSVLSTRAINPRFQTRMSPVSPKSPVSPMSPKKTTICYRSMYSLKSGIKDSRNKINLIKFWKFPIDF